MLGKLSVEIPSLAYLWIANIIFAASASVIRKLTEIGEQNFVDGTNPISVCNVLFIGNICAFAVMSLLFSRQENWQSLKQLSARRWFGLTVIGILSGAIGPALIFAALDNTTVTNVVLIGRVEPPLTLVLSYLLLKTRVNIWTAVGSGLAFTGVATTALLTNAEMVQPAHSMMGGTAIGRGELQAAAGALALAVATVLSKTHLQRISVGFFSLYRTFLGTIVFFVLAYYIYGLAHFAGALSPFLWLWMIVYSGIIVVAGQVCWFAGLRNATSMEVAIATSFNPIAAIAMAYVILGEVPTMAQYLGGSVILVGILLTLVGNLNHTDTKMNSTRFSMAKHMEVVNGFRGS
ncbi:MAG: DMT family transporter [Cyanophyceae cyanobacterium]